MPSLSLGRGTHMVEVPWPPCVHSGNRRDWKVSLHTNRRNYHRKTTTGQNVESKCPWQNPWHSSCTQGSGITAEQGVEDRNSHGSRKLAARFHLLEMPGTLHPSRLTNMTAYTRPEQGRPQHTCQQGRGNSWGPNPRTAGNQGLPHVGEIDFPREEPPNWLPNTKQP